MLRKLSLSCASLLIALLAAELLIRIAGAAPEVSVIRKGRFQLSRNPKIGFEPVPGLRYEGEDLSFYDYEGASNRLGYRDRDHEIAKPAGVWRIVVLGDSIGAGLRVERFEDTFPAVLERRLREQGVNSEVINLSVSGYNTQQEVETLVEKGLRYRPDLVLVAYSLTDRERVDGDILKTLLEAERSQGGGSARRVHPWLLQSALYRFVRYRVAPPRPVQASDAELQKLTDLISGDTVARYFATLGDLGSREGFRVMIAVFPRIVRNFESYRFADQHRYVRNLSRVHGFFHLDLLPEFARCREASPEPIGADNYHPSAAGHRCAAEAMARVILEKVRPPRRELAP
ncbi:MAG TPA: GDSL-type esterase/lipase family protein [Thermoanaerobaculia bacterium]|nr:GDSL-type esterase/lipase family protein [Thermoanaerobaculia bacterium]